ncbi:MAG: hypothetical protein HY556_01135 [Euryarchaeota archaeon]|nr:hypothetical protein [Euryarchaeota archaeon]
MSFLPTASAWINAGSGIVLLALGVMALVLGRGRPSSLFFGSYATLFGVSFFLRNLTSDDDSLDEVLLVAARAILLIAGCMLIALVVTFPKRMAQQDHRKLIRPALLSVAFVGAYLVIVWPRLARPADQFSQVGLAVFYGLLWCAILILAGRYSTAVARGDDSAWSQAAMLSVALLIFPGLVTGNVAVDAGNLTPWPPMLAMSLIVGSAWLSATRNAPRPAARLARNVSLFAFALPLAGMLVTASSPPGSVLDDGFNGVARILGAAVAAYAILRHQLLGLDLKVKWTIKQSTIAAAFIGVFFVVSETAQVVFAESLGTYIGIAAAGLLVFAIAPLQRAAEKVASAAMPGVKSVGEMSSEERARVYREAVAGAWADGNLSREEREMLERLAASLGLDDATTKALERDTHSEARPEGA